MRKNKETIDIFKIYQESKLNPLKYEEKHLEKKVRYKTPTLTRNVYYCKNEDFRLIGKRKF